MLSFSYARDGLGVYGFAQPLDMAALRAQFDFPDSTALYATTVHDSRNFVRLTQDAGPRPVRRLSFEL